MWLPRTPLSHEEIIEEFDQWVTPVFGTIRSSERFQTELSSLQMLVESIASVVLEEGCTHDEAIKFELTRQLREQNKHIAKSRLLAVINSIYLVTAKTDNSVKCQYPIYFRRRHGKQYLYIQRKQIKRGPAPSVVTAAQIVNTAIAVRELDFVAANELLLDYVNFLLDDDSSYKQFVALIEAYIHVDNLEYTTGRDLLAPMVSFQVRGSVAASGGHDPEEMVRTYLESWGLQAEAHFNQNDVTAADLNNWLISHQDVSGGRRWVEASSEKQRAFDFVIPFRATGFDRRIFVQSQFYAGDSGSVSHKNVDQASKARAYAADIFSDARFVELVDGAGYCASLGGDLAHLLFAADTADFVQLRSIPVRLRRILQESGIVVPLDIALLVCQSELTIEDLRNKLANLGIMQADGWIKYAVDKMWVARERSGLLEVQESRKQIVSEYVLLDTIVERGSKISGPGEYLIVPGYGKDFGVRANKSWEGDDLKKLLTQGVVERVAVK